ncbi:MAG: glycerophosphodiester phosphodiesterase family protein, partial [Actinomycetota bacterium]|nr:glycerophosphodiester phosphodiesterase family protein [Actinomycetota bacterium]
VEACKEKNVSVNVWTVNERERMMELIDFGVAGVITDFPDVALEFVKGRDS